MEDVPSSVESSNTALDQARLQAALNACTGTNQAVELSMDGAGNNAFLTGPISIPSGVTLLIDPGVTLYFSRNAQDYDTTSGVHTCGTVSSASNTASCKNLITLNNVSNAGIMGYGKIDGRGKDVVLNSFPTTGYEGSTTGKTWWDLANDANTYGGSQQNPRGIQINKSTNITFYKITFKNSPNFHVAVNTVNGFTVWGMHIVTPYTARNTDGIDPGNATNVTITQSWISDGDDNIALGANAGQTSNVSVIHNKFFAGHGESIGSITTFGINNALFDDNAMYGDADVDGSNSTAIRIKSANDRGGLVQNIQYSNSCFVNHGTQIQFTPVYNTNAGTLTPNFKNILLQNLRFSNAGATATGSFTFLGASNNGTVNPLQVTLDNVTVDTVATGNIVTPTNAQITFGPGQVSNNLVSLLTPFSGKTGNVVVDARTAPALIAPACTFTFLSPSLTGPNGVNQTVSNGQYPTAVVILQPAFAKAQAPYPTGTITVTDESSHTFTASLSGTGDTTFIPITNAATGVHTYTASYSGDGVYPPAASFGNYSVTVNGGSLASTTTTLTGVPTTVSFGVPFTITASVAGSGAATGSVSFLVNGAAYSTVPLSGGTASYVLAPSVGTYNLSAVYNGDTGNAGSISTVSVATITGASTTTSLQSSANTGIVGTPLTLTATVASSAGVPNGTVTFTYTTSGSAATTTAGTGTLVNGVATYSALLPLGVDAVTATYNGSGNYAGSASAPAVTITVSAAPPVPASTAPVVMPYTVSTVVGGGVSNATCTGHIDSFGDGCMGTSIVLPGGTDLRSVAADPFGAVYFTDSNSSLIRKVATNGIVTQFAGYISGTACVPTATAGCTPTLVKLGGKPRGVFGDPKGNLFIAGYNDNKVQVVSPMDGKMYLVAGTGTAPASTTDVAGDGGAANLALLKGPRAAATDAAGNVYIADSGDNRIREVVAPASGILGTGNIQTVAGTGTASYSGDGGLATAATLSNPQGVAVDVNGNIYIAEGSHVRVVCVNCTMGIGLAALLNKLGVPAPVNGNIYSIAGTTTTSNPTLAAGLGNTVSMGPQKIALDADGNIYIADSANNVVWFEDGRTGYTRVLVGGGTSTSCTGSAIGDGCVGTQAVIGSNSGNGFGLGFDSQGNLYVADSTNLRIRKVSTNLRFGSTAAGTAVSQTVLLHGQPGDAFGPLSLSSPDFSVSSGACSTNTDTTQDCTYTATFKPVVAGLRTTPVSVATTNANGGRFAFAGSGVGAGATVDPANQLQFGVNLSPTSIALDGSGNVLVADATSKNVLRFAPNAGGIGAGIAAASTVVGTFMTPTAVAADTLGNVYVADAATGLVSQVSALGSAQTLKNTFIKPQALATDAFNNVYVLDSSSKTVVEIGSNGLGSRNVASGLTAPTSLALDASGNIFVGDSGTVYRIDGQTLARTTASTASSSPSAIAVDAAGNLLVADSGAGGLLAIPSSGSSASFTVATGLPGNTLALDSAGNIYTTSSNNQITELLRTQGLATYNGTGAAASVFNLLSTGTSGATLAATDPDTSNFNFGLNSSADCTGTLSALSVSAGGTCSFTSSFTPSARQNYTNTISFAGNIANTAGATPLQITQVGSNAPFAVTLSLSPLNPATPTVSDTISVSANISSLFGTPAGTVTFSLDGIAQAPIVVSGGTATATFSGLSATSHTISAVFTTTDANFASGALASVTFTVAKLMPSALLSLSAANFVYGGTANAVVNLSGSAAIPTGTVHFAIDGVASGTPVAVSSSAATYKLPILLAGMHVVSATYSGDSTYQSATTAGVSVTVGKQDSTTTLTTSATSVNPGQSVTLTASVSALSSGTPTGTVTFKDGTTTLGTSALSAGVATYSTTTLLSGSHTVSATYSGDGNFNVSSGTATGAISVAALDFTLAAGAASVTATRGSSVSLTFQAAPTFGVYPGTVNFAVSGVPSGATAVVTPASIVSTSGTQSISVVISNTAAIASSLGEHPFHPRPLWALILSVPFVAFSRRYARNRLSKVLTALVLVFVSTAFAISLSGCGGNSSSSTSHPSTFSVVLTGTSGTLSHTATSNVTVQ